MAATGAHSLDSLARDQNSLAPHYSSFRVAGRLEESYETAMGEVLTRPVWNLEGARMPAILSVSR